MKAIVAILFVCLAAGANGGCLDKLNPFAKHHKQDYDLWGLEKWLDKKAPIDQGTTEEPDYLDEYLGQFYRPSVWENSTQLEVDLGILRANADRFRERKLQNTAQLILDIVDLKECNQQVLVVLNELARAKIVYGGSKRTEKILWKPLQALYKSCGEFVEQKLGPVSNRSLNEKQKQFVKLLEDTELWLVTRGFILDKYDHFLRPKDRRPTIWNDYFRRLSQNDDKALVSERLVDEYTFKTIHHRDRFDHVMNDHLMPSCKTLTASLRDKFDFVALKGLNSLRSMQQVNLSWDRFMSHRSKAIQSVTSAYNFCSTLQSLNGNFNDVFELVEEFQYDNI